MTESGTGDITIMTIDVVTSREGDDDRGYDRDYDRRGYDRSDYDRDHRRYRDRDDNDD
jgi:hypothetical protein